MKIPAAIHTRFRKRVTIPGSFGKALFPTAPRSIPPRLILVRLFPPLAARGVPRVALQALCRSVSMTGVRLSSVIFAGLAATSL